MSATKNHILVSSELPHLTTLFNGYKYQAETILADVKYYTRIYFENRKN